MPPISVRSLAPALLIASLGACAAGPPAADASGTPAAPTFVADRFFAGRLDGDSRLSILMRHAQSTHVTSNGRLDVDGTILLDQHVEQQGKPPRDRHWAIRPIGAGRYAGTLTDASGPVSGEAQGSRLHLSYPMRGGLRVDQWLTLKPDGRAADNLMVVRKMGIVVARLNETIRKMS